MFCCSKEIRTSTGLFYRVLLTSMYVYYIHVLCLKKPEESVRSSVTEVTSGCELT
ncbi:hypothetical protein LEMLEM_LOCUS27608, partial [Lemmus lemmus]